LERGDDFRRRPARDDDQQLCRNILKESQKGIRRRFGEDINISEESNEYLSIWFLVELFRVFPDDSGCVIFFVFISTVIIITVIDSTTVEIS
jgi:hypothetical protein